jgi:HPr kinase/phosphorylase
MIAHASVVSYNGAGLLILGPSGSGKSALALQMMALGCQLVADDQVNLQVRQGQVFALPAKLGQVEARFIGILAADLGPACVISLVVDLASIEKERMPPVRYWRFEGLDVTLLHKFEGSHFSAALLQYLKGSRIT